MHSLFNRLPAIPVLLLGFLSPPIFGAQTPEPAPVLNDRMGVASHFGDNASGNWNPETTIPLIAEMGVGWIREGVAWYHYEKEKGRYALPEHTRKSIEIANKAGLKIVFVLNYNNGLYKDNYDPVAYAKAAANLAIEMKGKIQAIEVLNEPNNFGFSKYYGGEWNGLPKDGQPAGYVVKYTELLNQASVAIKAANPDMKVIGLGAPTPANHRMLALGVSPAVDGLVDHPYSIHTVPEIVPFAATGGILTRDGIATADEQGSFASLIRMYREQSAKHRGPKEIWLTEWGFPTQLARSGKAGSFGGNTEDAQAKYTLRRYAECLGLGVEISIAYDFKNDGPEPHDSEQNFGFITFGDKPRLKPVYHAVQRFARFTAPYRIPQSPPTIEVFASPPRPEARPVVWDGSKLASTGSVRTYPFEKNDGKNPPRPMVLIWSTERAGSDLQPRAVDLEIKWTQPTTVKSVRAYDFFTDTWSDVKFKLKSGGRLWLPNVPAPDRPVALVFSDK